MFMSRIGAGATSEVYKSAYMYKPELRLICKAIATKKNTNSNIVQEISIALKCSKLNETVPFFPMIFK